MKQKRQTVGVPAQNGRATWVQTERRAHEQWAKLAANEPKAAALMHHLVARMERQNAVVVSQKVLAGLMGCSVETVKRAIRSLVAGKWVQIVKLNGPGTVSAYVVNDRVAFGERRENLRLSLFSATIVASADDQDSETLDHSDLMKIPVLFPGERQLPTGPGEEPPAEPSLDGLEPDLPALRDDPQRPLI
ncbi:hypothetical protein P0D88_34935 [Paraburkholderia sp. RL18-103-BIB-C]|uniref:helix-turn-helix domain-containing protein n=1 Tax=Paraburkholderia sp. RL18-103-BIB-C TaxID=3031637 RepID=UPI0038B6B97D